MEQVEYYVIDYTQQLIALTSLYISHSIIRPEKTSSNMSPWWFIITSQSIKWWCHSRCI